MKVQITRQAIPHAKNLDTNVYLARHKETGALVLVGRHSVIIIEGEKFGTTDGDGWTDILCIKDRCEPLKKGEIVTLENTYE